MTAVIKLVFELEDIWKSKVYNPVSFCNYCSEATKRADGRWTIVVEIFGKGKFQGIGRNCQIAKGAAAKRALRHLKSVKY